MKLGRCFINLFFEIPSTRGKFVCIVIISKGQAISIRINIINLYIEITDPIQLFVCRFIRHGQVRRAVVLDLPQVVFHAVVHIHAETGVGHTALREDGVRHIDADIRLIVQGLEVEDGVGVIVEIDVAGRAIHSVVGDLEVVIEIQPGVRAAHAYRAAVGGHIAADGAIGDGQGTALYKNTGTIDCLIGVAGSLIADDDSVQRRRAGTNVQRAAVAGGGCIAVQLGAVAHGDGAAFCVYAAAAACGGDVLLDDGADVLDGDRAALRIHAAAVFIRRVALYRAAGHDEGTGHCIHRAAAAAGSAVIGHAAAGQLHRTGACPDCAAVGRCVVCNTAPIELERQRLHMHRAAVDRGRVLGDGRAAAVDVDIGVEGIDRAAAGCRLVITDRAAGDVGGTGGHVDRAAVLGAVGTIFCADRTAADRDGIAACIVQRAAGGGGVALHRAAADIYGACRGVDRAAFRGGAIPDRAAGHIDRALQAVDRAAVAARSARKARGRVRYRRRLSGGHGGLRTGFRVEGGCCGQIGHADISAQGQRALVADHGAAEDKVAIQDDIAKCKNTLVAEHGRRHVALAGDGGSCAASIIIVRRGQGDVEIRGDHRRVAGGHQVIRQHLDGPCHGGRMRADVFHGAGQRVELAAANAADSLRRIGQPQLRVGLQIKAHRAVVSHCEIGLCRLGSVTDGLCAQGVVFISRLGYRVCSGNQAMDRHAVAVLHLKGDDAGCGPRSWRGSDDGIAGAGDRVFVAVNGRRRNLHGVGLGIARVHSHGLGYGEIVAALAVDGIDHRPAVKNLGGRFIHELPLQTMVLNADV